MSLVNNPGAMAEELQLRIHGSASFPTLIYLPGLCDYRVIARADHNVLGTAPGKAAELVLRWIYGL